MSHTSSSLKAKNIMTAEPVCVSPSTRVRELARIFEQHEVSGAPVVDHLGKVVGVVSKTDLIRRCSEGIHDVPPAYLFEILSERGAGSDDSSEVIPEPLICVEDFMTANPLTVTPETPVAAVARLMFENRFHRVIVADAEGAPIGIITSMDLLSLIR